MSLFQVSSYIIFTDKSLLTKLATEGEIILMNSHLVRPKFSTTEGFITDIADIFPVFLLPVSVCQMVGQLSARGKSLATEVGREYKAKSQGYLKCHIESVHEKVKYPRCDRVSLRKIHQSESKKDSPNFGRNFSKCRVLRPTTANSQNYSKSQVRPSESKKDSPE